MPKIDQPKISVIIRCLNEAPKVEKILQKLKQQTGIKQSEIQTIVIDNESSDNTREIAAKYGAELYTIKRGEFTHPKSMNLGMSKARADIAILTVGHALPPSSRWLAAIIPHFRDPRVAGVYGPTIPHPDHTWIEWVSFVPLYWWFKLVGARVVRRRGTAVMMATNAAYRTSLWQNHHFDESYEMGGEDGAWARQMLTLGYYFVREPLFTVFHSHSQDVKDFLKHISHYRKMRRPNKFSRQDMSFRNDLNLHD